MILRNRRHLSQFVRDPRLIKGLVNDSIRQSCHLSQPRDGTVLVATFGGIVIMLPGTATTKPRCQVGACRNSDTVVRQATARWRRQSGLPT
jgi:hypothetical protein